MVQNMYVIQGHVILQLFESKVCFLYAHVQCISELCFNFQIPASNTLGGVVETRTVLKRMTDVRMYVVRTDKGKTICHSRSAIMT